MAKRDPLTPASIDWHGAAPHAADYGDIYFSGTGPDETRHVFLAGNDLTDRLRAARRFTVGELGFGTGLNFLALWDLWRRTPKPPGARLHFLSVEKRPLSRQDLERAHAAWPELAPLAERLREAYPPIHSGFHRRDFDDLRLTLYFGEALAGLRGAEASVNAWFLDGFSPARNPDMWSAELMEPAAALTAPGGTFATYTVAGDVRRALERAGFTLARRQGYGRKREMLTGRLAASPSKRNVLSPWFDAGGVAPLEPGARVAIIGAGIAGAMASYHLRQEGFEPVIYDAVGVAAGASGNPAGIIMPRLDVDDTPAGRFHAGAYLYAVTVFREAVGPDVFLQCGARLAFGKDGDGERFERLVDAAALPADWMTFDDDGLFFPQGGVVDARALTGGLLDGVEIVRERVRRIEETGAGVRLIGASGEIADADAVIIANGLDALRFKQLRGLPLAGSAGQIDVFDRPGPEHAVAFGPYAAPAPAGGMAIGAVYRPARLGDAAQATAAFTSDNLAAVAARHPELVQGLDPSQARPRAAIRCTTPDRCPVVGPVPDWGFYAGAYDGLRRGSTDGAPPAEYRPRLFVLTGLGSRGLVTAALAAAGLGALLSGAPAPYDRAVANALHPARFFIRDLKRATPRPRALPAPGRPR